MSHRVKFGDRLDVTAEEVLRKTVMPHGNGCHVTVPKRFEGRDVMVVVLDVPEKDVRIAYKKKVAQKGRMEV